jgi:hypothetical protein
VDGTDLLLHHGYHFRLEEDGRSIVAWPRRAGRTGVLVFRVRAADGVAVHDNRDGHWSGLRPRPAHDDVWNPER